ncbi:MAG: hypothetical protein IPP69_07275 [Flavobacteriales bacterium]|nr:hypothetical protein [Flavobacteriales bacterium]
MIDNLKYQTLQEIAGNIKHKLDNLLTGELSKSDLENLTEASRELFERLIVLRYKAYDGEVKEQVVVSAPIAQQQTPDTESLPEISFRLEETKAEEPLQISLIDAIEEVTKTEVNTHVPEETKVVPMITEPSKPAANVMSDVKESLHEKLSRVVAASESLAEKMENNPIPDLKRAITLNQRFQFSRELFKGNNQDYEVAIDKLNNTTREDAMQQLASLRSKYAWSEESTVTTDFVELIERRYM